MDPVTQTLAQQQSGTAQGEGFGSYFVQGRQLGLAQKRLALEERQVKMQETEQSMILPLKRDLLKAQALNVGVEYKANVMKAQLMSEGNAALPEMLDLALRIQGTPDGYTREVYKEEFRGILKRNPGAGLSEVGQKLWQGFEAQPMYDARFKRIEEMHAKYGDKLENFDPTTGRTSFQPAGGIGYAPTDTMKNLQALSEAERTGDANAITALRQQLKLDGLGELDVIKLRSELRALDNNILLDETKKARLRQDIYMKYDALARGSRESAQSEEAVRVLEGGRKAIFNSRTKQFLRYAD